MSLLAKIESILFVASKPLSVGKIAKALGKESSDVEETLHNLRLKYNRQDSGIHIVHEADTYQMMTNPENAEAINGFIKNEVAGELTRAQLETLTVIAYRGPITRPELEQIRGVNCAIIIRNLRIRGLVDESQSKTDLQPYYSLSLQALQHLGITTTSELPEYDTLHAHAYIEQTLANNQT